MTRGMWARRVWVAVLSGLALLAGRPRAEGAKPLLVPKDRAGWEIERPKVRQTITAAVGDLPAPRILPSFKVLDTRTWEGVPIERFEITPESGPRLRGVLVFPAPSASGDRDPVVIFLGDDPSLGSREPLNPGPDGVPPALTLARRGIAVFCLDTPGLATEHRPADGHPYIPGTDGEGKNDRRPLWPQILRNDMIGLKALLEDPGIDPKRVAVLGYGLGGTRAFWLMALDERIACGVAVNGLTRLGDWQADAPEGAPRSLAPWAKSMLRQYDTDALIALCAPRPLAILAGDRDPATPPSGFDLLTRAGERTYALYDKKGNFSKTHFGRLGGELTLLEWDMMIEPLDKHLLPQGPTPLGHPPEPEPAVNERFLNPAEHGLAGWVAEMSQRETTWTWRDGTIVCAPGKNEYGWLRAPIEVEDFILQLEWKVPKGGNTGVFLRARPVPWNFPPSPEAKMQVATLGLDWPSRTGLELQAQDDPGQASKYSSGALYRHAAPAENPIKPAGEWNRYTVRCRGMRVEVWSNGKQVLDTTIDHFPTLRNPPLRGYIGLQNHGVGAEFRNVRLLRLEPGA